MKPPELPALVFATSHLESLNEHQAFPSESFEGVDLCGDVFLVFQMMQGKHAVGPVDVPGAECTAHLGVRVETARNTKKSIAFSWLLVQSNKTLHWPRPPFI